MSLRDKFFKAMRYSPTEETAGAKGFGAPLHIAYETRELPGAGARQIAYETLALPMYTPIGWGVANRAEIRTSDSAPVQYQQQAIGIQSLFYNGNPSGQFVNEPLVNTDAAQSGGLIVPQYPNPMANELPT